MDDQISNPTWARMLAEATGQILARGTGYIAERKGLYHLAGGGYASRFEWAKEIIALDPKTVEQKVHHIEPAKNADFPTPAARPQFSALDCGKTESVLHSLLHDWRMSLKISME